MNALEYVVGIRSFSTTLVRLTEWWQCIGKVDLKNVDVDCSL
jgi:hypothetical protein